MMVQSAPGDATLQSLFVGICSGFAGALLLLVPFAQTGAQWAAHARNALHIGHILVAAALAIISVALLAKHCLQKTEEVRTDTTRVGCSPLLSANPAAPSKLRFEFLVSYVFGIPRSRAAPVRSRFHCCFSF
jgi:hypothetical protein